MTDAEERPKPNSSQPGLSTFVFGCALNQNKSLCYSAGGPGKLGIVHGELAPLDSPRPPPYNVFCPLIRIAETAALQTFPFSTPWFTKRFTSGSPGRWFTKGTLENAENKGVFKCWRGGRAAEGAALEMLYGRKFIKGSNPFLSASNL